MKKFLSVVIAILFLLGIRVLANLIFGDHCDKCGDKILVQAITINGYSEKFCSEWCAKTWGTSHGLVVH